MTDTPQRCDHCGFQKTEDCSKGMQRAALCGQYVSMLHEVTASFKSPKAYRHDD